MAIGPRKRDTTEELPRFPHCDQRILHAPGECEFCDACPQWQQLRKAWGIAFTGHMPAVDGDRCGARLDERKPDGHWKVCMQARGHDPDTEPHSDLEPWEALPCPADAAVMRHDRGDHTRWPGNRAETP